jgi:hypothetical protein
MGDDHYSGNHDSGNHDSGNHDSGNHDSRNHDLGSYHNNHDSSGKHNDHDSESNHRKNRHESDDDGWIYRYYTMWESSHKKEYTPIHTRLHTPETRRERSWCHRIFYLFTKN